MFVVVLTLFFFFQSKSRIEKSILLVASAMTLIINENRVALFVLILIPFLGIYTRARLIPFIFIVPIAISLLLSIDRISDKMFYSGSGNIYTFIDNPADVRSNGRIVFFKILIEALNLTICGLEPEQMLHLEKSDQCSTIRINLTAIGFEFFFDYG